MMREFNLFSQSVRANTELFVMNVSRLHKLDSFVGVPFFILILYYICSSVNLSFQ
jgi:hypothetical protein